LWATCLRVGFLLKNSSNVILHSPFNFIFIIINFFINANQILYWLKYFLVK
jgi:hypothetical protein